MIGLQEIRERLPDKPSIRTWTQAAKDGTIRVLPRRGGHYKVSDQEASYLTVCGGTLLALRRVMRVERSVRGCILFGSFATGRVGSHSDIDLLVDIESPDLLEVARLRKRLSQKLGREIDLYQFDDLRANQGVMKELAETGRPIIDRSGLWTKLHYVAGHSRQRARK